MLEKEALRDVRNYLNWKYESFEPENKVTREKVTNKRKEKIKFDDLKILM